MDSVIRHDMGHEFKKWRSIIFLKKNHPWTQWERKIFRKGHPEKEETIKNEYLAEKKYLNSLGLKLAKEKMPS